MDSSKSKKGETTQDTNKINRSDEEIGQEKPAVNDKPKGRTVFKQNDKITCPICQTEWTGQISYVNHLRVHKNYQLCTMCEELIPINNVTMAIHIREKHSGKNPYKCKICGRGYKTKNGVKNHYVSVHADSSARYWCELCDRAFGTKNNYTSHMRSHMGGNKCFICVQKFDDKNLLCMHMRDCHANYLCLICSSYFADLSELRQHESSHTEEEREFGINVDIRQFYGSTEAENTENDDTENTEYKLMQNSSDIVITENMHFEKQPDLTENATREIAHNNSKRKSANKVDDHGGTARKSFKCKFCGRVFKVAMHFTRHIRLHNNKSNFTCQHCGKVCKNEETFKHHIALHLPDDKKPHQCEHCSKGFVTSTSLKKHLLVHSKAKDYICEFCGKAFRDTTKLQVITIIL
jgi:KRAB domain-containing zinc finger protein